MDLLDDVEAPHTRRARIQLITKQKKNRLQREKIGRRLHLSLSTYILYIEHCTDKLMYLFCVKWVEWNAK